VENVGILGRGIDEHGAAEGILAELVADQLAEAFEQWFSRMHPDAGLAVFGSHHRQRCTLISRVDLERSQERVNRAFPRRLQGEDAA
jgi:hypothetical protein